jgi:hypothetical protein
MPFVHRLSQREGDASAHPDQRGLLDTELGRDLVGRAEADATDVAGKPIRVFGDQSDGVGAVALVDAHRPRRADTIAV